MAYIYYNPNPAKKLVGDCVVRALSKTLDQPWSKTYVDLMVKGLMMHDMPSANSVWGAYLKDRGFERFTIPNECPDCYTVHDFCSDYTVGTYVLGTGSHVIAVENGDYFDTWDSGDEIPIYYWKRRK